jgi:hypothetical protein
MILKIKIILLVFIISNSLNAMNSDSTKIDSSNNKYYRLYSFLKPFIIGVGTGYHFGDNQEEFKGQYGYLWNFNVELLLDEKHIWSLELIYFKLNNALHGETYIDYQDQIISFLVKYHLTFLGSNIYPSINAGFSQLIFGYNLGFGINFYIIDRFLIKAYIQKIKQLDLNIAGSGLGRYSPYIFNINLCYHLNFFN